MSRMTAPRIRPGGRVRGAIRVNLAGGCGTVWNALGAPGSVLLTLFLQEWLQAEKWQIGLVVTMNFLGPVLEPVGAYLDDCLGCRRPLFLRTFLLARTPFLLFAILPFISSAQHARLAGIFVVLAVVGLTRIPTHLGSPAWWGWIADLVPTRRQSRFFGCRSQIAGFAAAISFLIAATLLQVCGGMRHAWLLSALFLAGAPFGILDILLYLRVPDVPSKSRRAPTPRSSAKRRPRVLHHGRVLAAKLREAYRAPTYGRFFVGMGIWSLSANLMLPFLPVYQRGEVLAGQFTGFGISWLSLAVLIALANLAAMFTSRFWASLCERIGPRRVQLIGSGYLFVYLLYPLLGARIGPAALATVAIASGALNAAWSVAVNQLVLGLAPARDRGYYVSAYNATIGALMAGGPLLGGWLADRLPLLGWSLPGGLPCCYFHLLIVAAVLGGVIALLVLFGRAEPRPATVPIAVRVRLLAMKDLRRQREVSVWRLRMVSSADAGATRGAHGRNLDDPLSRERAAGCAGPGASGGSPRK